MINHILLHDFDGTLVDSKPDISAALYSTFELLKIPTEKLNRIEIGPPLLEMLLKEFPEFTPATTTAITKNFRSTYDNGGFPNTRANPGVSDYLKASIQKNISNFIATNKPLLATQRILEKLNLTQCFKGIYSLGEFVKKMPGATKTEMVASLLTEHPHEKEKTFLIGDSYIDIRAAKGNGISAIAYTGGYTREQELKALAPEYCISHYSQVLEIITQIRG